MKRVDKFYPLFYQHIGGFNYPHFSVDMLITSCLQDGLYI